MNIKNLFSVLIVCCVLSGCGLAQRMELDRQYKEQKKNATLSMTGVKAMEYLLKDDQIIASEGGKSLCQGGCSPDYIIKNANNKPLAITALYVALHDYSGPAPSLHDIESPLVRNSTMAEILHQFSAVFGSSRLSDTEHVSKLYSDFTKDRENLGLNEVSEESFKNSVNQLRKRKEEIVLALNSMREVPMGVAKQLQERNDELEKEKLSLKKSQSIASERVINLTLWDNPSKPQRHIEDALSAIKFTIRDDGFIYANGRRFMYTPGLEYFRNSLDLSLSSCADAGAYVGDNSLGLGCAKILAQDITLWGETAKNRKISDAAWNRAAVDGQISYNPIKYEILFSHWVGMARVYSSRGV